jgi:hypothetical protein
MTDSAAEGTRRQRPVGVVVIAVFLVADAVLSLAEHLFGIGTGTRQGIFADGGGQVSLLIIVLVILRLAAAVGLWLRWRRGWVLTMLLVGASLVINLWLYWQGQPLYLRMAIDVVLALYLNQGAVREYFVPQGPRTPATDPGPEADQV